MSYLARQKMKQEQRAAKAKARSQEDSFRRGYTSPTPPASPKKRTKVEPYSGPGAPVQGGAKDDPDVKIEVGPDGVVHRRRR